MKKKLLTLFLMFAMALGYLIPQSIVVNAEESHQEINDKFSFINPLYKDVLSEEDLIFDSDDSISLYRSPSYETDQNVIASTLREGMINRLNQITVYYQTTEPYSQQWAEAWTEETFQLSLEETSDSHAGDYLRWTYAGYNISAEGTSDGTTTQLAFTYYITYYTTYEQEEALDTEISNTLNALGVNSGSKNDLEKIQLIYDYITENVSYDYTNLNNPSYTLKFTAYAAMINKTAVCQGYATLLYRMLNDCGIDARVITGSSNGEAHAWNIVKLDGIYYLLDATWDAGQNKYLYFLKGSNNFYDHSTDAAYTNDAFTSIYPISSSDYIIKAETSSENDFEYTVSKGKATITKYTGTAQNVTVPSKIGGYPVKEIATYAFYETPGMKSLTFSEGIETLNGEALFHCMDLESIHFPSTMIFGEYGDSAESGLSNLPSKCANLKNITVNESSPYVTVQDGVLYSKDMTQLLLYPAGDSRTVFEIPKGIVRIANSAFEDSSYLNKVTMPDSVDYIGYWAFSGARSLNEINISKNCTVIGQYAFAHTSLKKLSLPASVEMIVGGAFYDIQTLESITIASGNESYYTKDGVLFCGNSIICYPSKKAATSYTFPNHVTYVDFYAFSYATNLKQITLNNNLAKIGHGAFTDCENLENITIPSSVYLIEDSAFMSCYNLKAIEVRSSQTKLEGEFLFANNDSVIIRAKSGSQAEKFAHKYGYTFQSIDTNQTGWIEYINGWWYKNEDGSYPVNCWKEIDGNWYYFDKAGYRAENWKQINQKWYYFDPETGIMTSEKWIGNYYVGSNGKMAIGWTKIDGSYYYFDSNGAKVKNKWIDQYFLKSDGIMATNEWVCNGKYYVGSNGAYKTGWLELNEGWYFLTPAGAKKSGWISYNGKSYYTDINSGLMYENQWLNDTYYFKNGGQMVTGWKLIDGSYYYFLSNGKKATNRWVGHYYVGEDGIMATDQWIGEYYVDINGKWVPDADI